MLYSAAIAETNPYGGGNGMTGKSYHDPAHGAGSAKHIASATNTSELPLQATFEMMRFQMVNSSMNADITRGIKSASSVLTLLPTIIRNIS